MDQAQAIGELLGMLRRRLPLIALVSTVGILATLLFAISMPPVYETSAKILIESPQISDELARSTVNLTAAQRLQLIEERLLARDNLIKVVDRLGLFADSPKMTRTDQVKQVREAVRIDSISVSGQTQNFGAKDGGLFAFTIAVRLDNAEKAAKMVNQFVDSAIEQNLRVRAERAQDTLAYFVQESQRIGDAVAAVEGEIAAYKEAHEEALPESLTNRRGELAQLQVSALDIDRRILELEARQGELTAALASGRPLRTDASILSPEETELRQLELQLAQKRLLLKPNHPEIHRLEDRIAAVKTLVAPLSQGADGGQASSAEDQRKAAQRQIDQLADQVTLLTGQKSEMAARKELLDASIRATPEVEAGLSALIRRLQDLQAQLTDITRRRADARTGEQLEASQQAERFQVIETALVPEDPVGPNRKKIAVLGSGAGIGLALGLAFLIEMLHPVLRSSAQMERQLGLRPVISIPYVAAPGELWRRRRTFAVRAALVAVGLVLILAIVDRGVMPLSPLGKAIAKRIGLSEPSEKHVPGA